MSRNDAYPHYRSSQGRISAKTHHNYRPHQHGLQRRYNIPESQHANTYVPGPFEPIQPQPFLPSFDPSFNHQPQSSFQPVFPSQLPLPQYTSQPIEICPTQWPQQRFVHAQPVQGISNLTKNWNDKASNSHDLAVGQVCSLNQTAVDTLCRLQLPANQITETGIIPNSPYYELPAGLMVPLVSPSQRDYKTLNPAHLRLPLPKFSDEGFLRKIESYYAPDSKIRDNDGWDREFIDAYLNQKEAIASLH